MALAPIPAVPDAERRTRYVLTAASSASMQVGFAIWASGSDYANWVEVWQNGVKLATTQWTLTSPSGPLANLPRPITNAVINPQVSFNGTIDIVGAERPRRPIQFTEGVGVPARDHNRAYNDSTAIDREFWDIFRRTLRGAPGEDINPIPPVVTRKTKSLGFDTAGHPIVSDKTMTEIDDAVDLIKYLEGLLAGLQKGNPNIVVLSSVAALRGLTTASVTATAAIVQAYFAGGDVGGGVFRLDVDDTTSADNKGLIIVDASARRWKRIVGSFATLDMFGNPTVAADISAAANACFVINQPMLLTGNQTVTLNVDPLLGTTNDIGAWAKISTAADWSASCVKRGKSILEINIQTALDGPIHVYGQYIYNNTTATGNDMGQLSFKMPTPFATTLDLTNNVVWLARRSEVICLNMNQNKAGAIDLTGTEDQLKARYPMGLGYSSPPTVTIVPHPSDTTGGGATAVAYLDPFPPPGQEGRLGGFRITNPGSGWDPLVSRRPTVVLSGGGTPTRAAFPTVGVNAFIQQCTAFVTKFPTNIQNFMPVGIFGYGGVSQDVGAINGCHMLKDWVLNVPADLNPDGTVKAANSGGRIIFDVTAPRASGPLIGSVPTIVTVQEVSANIYFPNTWLVSTGGWFGAGEGEGMFTCNGNGTLSLHLVAMMWRPNTTDLDTGKTTPQPSHTDQCGIESQKDGAIFYLKDRVMVTGFPGSGIRIARGVCFMNRGYVGGGTYVGVESYMALQVQNGGYFGVSFCSFGSSNGAVVAVQGGAVGYITHCCVGSGATGISIYGWCDVQVTKVFCCTKGIQCLAGGRAYGIYNKPDDPSPVKGRTSTMVTECDTGLDLSLGGQFNSRIQFHRCTKDSTVPVGTQAFGGGWYGTAPNPLDPTRLIFPNQTVQVLQVRRQSEVVTATTLTTAATLQPAGVVTTLTTVATAAGGTYVITISNPYVNTTSFVRCAIHNGTNTGGVPILSTVEPLAPSFQVRIFNAGTTAFNGSLKISFMIDEIHVDAPEDVDPELIDQITDDIIDGVIGSGGDGSEGEV